MRKLLLGGALGLCLAAVLPLPLWAQWSGGIGAGYVWQNATGNEDAFVTQYGQRQGFVLDDFDLAYTPTAGQQEFGVSASGFGGAEPSAQAALFFRPPGGWSFNLNYDKMTSFFDLASGDFKRTSDRWTLEHWRGAVVYNGLKAVKLTLGLRYTKRGGYVFQPIYGQRTAFGAEDNYNQDMKEVSFKIETKTLPVYLSFEQSYARYETQDRWSPAAYNALFGTRGSHLADLSTPREDKTDVPTSRLIATYHNDWVDVAGSALYSKWNMDSTGKSLTIYDVSPNAGQFRWLDEAVGSANLNTKAANLDAAFHLGAGWSVRVAGDYNDSTQDSYLYGPQILSLGQPGGAWLNLTTLQNTNGFFNTKDTNGRIELQKAGLGWSVYGGYQSGSRDVSWRREKDDTPVDVSRTGDGWYAGGTWSRSPLLRVNVEYEHGTFSHYVFRTEPDLVQRFTFKLSSDLGGGWTVGARYRWETGENPSSIAYDHHHSQAYGANLGWTNPKGTGGFGLTAENFTLDSRTNIFLPGGAPSFSLYNLDMHTVTANAYFTVGKVRIDGDLTNLRDTGFTWPFQTWGADVRATIDGPMRTQFSLFCQYHSYNEDMPSLNNFVGRRLGAIVRWRF